MIVLFGTKVRLKDIGNGDFYCPQCRAQRPYRRLRARRYFTLYFIPLFPLGDSVGEFVQCTVCNTQFEPAVLDYTPPTVADRHTQNARTDVRAGMPLQMAARKLVNAGLSEDDARQTVLRASSVSFRQCPACGMTFHESIAQCTNCGATTNMTMTSGIQGTP